jgi:MFS superfamily sulfate permease-like transporter
MVMVQLILAAEASQAVNVQSLEYLIRPYVGYLTFGIDIAAGIIIAISAATAFFTFKILRKSPKEQTQEKET